MRRSEGDLYCLLLRIGFFFPFPTVWTGKGIDILCFANCDHAQVLDKRVTRRPLVRATRGYCAQTGGDYSRSVDP
jgi:hypothetical protein